MHTRVLYRAFHSTNQTFEQIVQDLSVPYSAAEPFIDCSASDLNIWPLWLCPLREIQGPTFHPSTTLSNPCHKAEPMLNIGVWGPGSKDKREFMRQNDVLENTLKELGGRKVLYSSVYYNESEFWGLYNKSWYDDLRQRYCATSLPTVYDKVKVSTCKEDAENLSRRDRILSIWPVAGLVGIKAAIRSEDYMLHRKPLCGELKK